MSKHVGEINWGDVKITEKEVPVYFDTEHGKVTIGTAILDETGDGLYMTMEFKGITGEAIAEYIKGDLIGFSVIAKPGYPHDPTE